MKKAIKYIGIGILVLIVLGIFASGDEGPTPATNSDSNQATGTSKKEDIVYELNQEAQDKDLKFTVLDVTTSSTIGNSYFAEDAQGMFHVVQVKIENTGKETVSFDSSMAQVVDDQGRTFDRSIDGQTAMITSNDGVDLFLQQIQPGLSVTGNLVFDLPESIESAYINLKGGFFSEGVKVRIK